MSRRTSLLSWTATALLAVAVAAFTPTSLHADTIGFWRFDEEGAVIETAVSETNTLAYADTLAAAHAESGNFADARKVIAEALLKADPGLTEKLKQRAKAYAKEKPWRS